MQLVARQLASAPWPTACTGEGFSDTRRLSKNSFTGTLMGTLRGTGTAYYQTMSSRQTANTLNRRN